MHIHPRSACYGCACGDDFETVKCVLLNITYNFLELATGTAVQKDTIYRDFIVQAVITFTTLSMPGVANLVELQIPTSRATMRMFGRNLTGIDKGWCHVAERGIISPVFIDPLVTICIVLRNSSAVNCRVQDQVGIIH